MARLDSSIGLRMNTALFFDRSGVIKQTEARERRVLGRVGAIIRRSARSSIRSRKRPRLGKRGRATRPSRPGEPPISWTKPGIKDILFQYVPSSHSVVAGPIMFNGGDDVPGLLELGGTTQITSRFDRDGRKLPQAQKRQAKYEPRPFMGPALETNQAQILDLFASVR